MLPRILEPELMDTPSEVRDYNSMDHAEVNRRFVDDLLAELAKAEGRKQTAEQIVILDLGTGTAQIPIELCRRSDGVTVVAVDAGRHMLDVAAENIAAAGLAQRIKLRLADAKSLPSGDAEFDCVISNSIVHHLSDPAPALHEAIRVARSGGMLFFRDLLRPATEAELASLVDRYAPAAGLSASADHQRGMFADSLHSALTLAEIRELVAPLGFGPESVQQTSDRHWTWNAVRRA